MNLVQILYGLMIAYMEQHWPVASLSGVFTSANLRKAITIVPELEPYLQAYMKGKEIDYTGLAKVISDYKAEYSQHAESKASFAAVLGAFVSWYRTGSAGAFKRLEKLSLYTQDKSISQSFIKDSVDQAPIKKSMTKIVKQLSGENTHHFTLDQAKEAKEKNPELYKAYLKLRSEFNSSWKTALSNYIRASGGKTVPFKEANAFLTKNGFEHTMPTGFTGNIDADGKWYTKDGSLVNGVPSVAMFPSVKMNPSYDVEKSPWVFQAVTPEGKLGNYFYTNDFGLKQARNKFAKVANFDVDATRKKWLPAIRSFDIHNPNHVAAVILEILYRSSNRVGTKENGSYGGGFGISTLRVKHVYPQTNGGYRLIYSGKDSIRTTYLISPNEDQIAKAVCNALGQLIEGKKPSERLFNYAKANGKNVPVGPGYVNKVFKAISGGLTVHKLRTAKGTSLFREYLNKVFSTRTNVDSKAAMEILKKGGTIVGKELNHVRRSTEGMSSVTPATAIKNYIDPQAQAELFSHYNLPLPVYLEKLMRSPELGNVSVNGLPYDPREAETFTIPQPPQPMVKQPVPPPQIPNQQVAQPNPITTPAPAAPAIPQQPVNPVAPTAPAKPTQPVAPTQPVQPSQPQAPAQEAAPEAFSFDSVPTDRQVEQHNDEEDEPDAEVHLDITVDQFLAGERDLWEDN